MNTDKFEWTDELVAEYGQFFHNAFNNPVKNLGKCMLTEFKLSKLRLPILITEDGVEIFNVEQVLWCVYIEEGYGYSLYIPFKWSGFRGAYENQKRFMKVFSSIETAQEWIVNNKPCLSVNDVMGLVMSPKQMPDYRANIIQLAKNKL